MRLNTVCARGEVYGSGLWCGVVLTAGAVLACGIVLTCDASISKTSKACPEPEGHRCAKFHKK